MLGHKKMRGGTEPKDVISGKQPGECSSKTSNSSSGSKDERESEGEQDVVSQENEGGTEPKDGISGKQLGECNSKTSNSSSGSKEDRESGGEQDVVSQENEGGTEPKDGLGGKQPGECNSKTSNSSSATAFKSDRVLEREQVEGSEETEGGFDGDGSGSGDASGYGGGDDDDDDDDDGDDDDDDDETQKKVKVHQDLSFQLQFDCIQFLSMSKLPLSDEKTVHRALTVRLREGREAVTVLTGLDDQLNDLMKYIPEVASSCMDCDIDKTDEPSNLKGQSSFFPEVIINALENIFTFITSGRIMEGHTYWLVKGDKGKIKLHDLTSIRLQTNYVWKDECTRITVLMAVLFYRVANNMLFKDSPFILTKHGTIHKLLDNCLALTLDGDDRLPEIFAAASYLLSDNYTVAAPRIVP
ncbi:unnamed protein product [Porites lobata]|uniref:EDRF1 N-terminal domain-containing protein n=1 Tax=Porites lobata TaxID=104759 RepID=A0ABN8QUS9_9CNID|nr:unnamed protein product [Porites lobata]